MTGPIPGDVCGIEPGGPLRGFLSIPGDKSISHRALLMGALADGTGHIHGICPGADVKHTCDTMAALGAGIRWDGADVDIGGVGLFGLSEPGDILDCGNAGTTARLLMGLLAGQPFFSVLTGDGSLRRRPMARLAGPLRTLGARVEGREGGDRLPMAIRGGNLKGGVFALPVASAQLKTALMLAGLYCRDGVTIVEPASSRDHTERMFAALELPMERSGCTIVVKAGAPFPARDWFIPGDFSSAAFFVVAALLIPGSDIGLRAVGLNPTRTGLLHVLQRMGADIALSNQRVVDCEPVGDVRVRHSALVGVLVGGDEIPRMIDELPVLAVAAAFARGRTEIRDASELRLKESDRIAVLCRALDRAGIEVTELPDGLIIEGGRVRGGSFRSDGDHRIAMALIILAKAAQGASVIQGVDCIETSFPGFWSVLGDAQGGD